MTGELHDNSDDVALSGEYVLGLLPQAERRAFEQRLVQEQVLRQLVVEWDEALAPLTDDIQPVAPPAYLQATIEARVFGRGGTGARDTRRGRTEARRGGRRRGAMLASVAGALAAAAVVIAVILIDPGGPGIDPTHTARIEGDTAEFVFTVNLSEESGVMEIAHLSGDAPEGRVFELWLIQGDQAPVSLGVLPTSTVLTAEQRAGLAGAVLAVSEEPPGGSPTGAPTGNVLAMGSIEAL